MKKTAFTLIELLIVIVLLALLASLLIPTVGSAMRVMHDVQCASNLRQIDTAFPLAQSRNSAGGKPLYPAQHEWPRIPHDVVKEGGIFLCPGQLMPREEREAAPALMKDYAVFSLEDSGGKGIYINFKCTDALPYRRVFDRGSYWEFWFDDGKLKDIGSLKTVDMVFHVSKTTPPVAEYQDVDHYMVNRNVSVTYKKEIVAGWERFGAKFKGDNFTMGGLLIPTDYGFNRSVEFRVSVAPSTIILLDYNTAIANNGEDMSETIEAAARHNGKSNVLYGDGSVTSKTPFELDPIVAPGNWMAD